MEEQTDRRLTQADVDQDQAGFFGLMKSCHMKLPSHNGKPLADCPVCKMFFLPNPNLKGKPLESYRMIFIDMSEPDKFEQIQNRKHE